MIYINHYFNPGSSFEGKSTKQSEQIRRDLVQKAIASLREIPNSTVHVCGVEGYSLLPIDQNFSHLDRHEFLIFESIQEMFDHVDEYDYFINIEDDVLLIKEVFEDIVNFDKEQEDLRFCFHPNRLEEDAGSVYSPDINAKPGWEDVSPLTYKGAVLKVGNNPHSGLMVLSHSKMHYAKSCVDLESRERTIGYYMASAYANVNAPFHLYRSVDLEKHAVYHLDHWEVR